MFAAAKKLYSKPHGKVGGGVPEVKVLDRPSSLGTLPPDNKAFIDKFIMPFMDKMGVPQNELLQVTLTIYSNLGDNIVQWREPIWWTVSTYGRLSREHTLLANKLNRRSRIDTGLLIFFSSCRYFPHCIPNFGAMSKPEAWSVRYQLSWSYSHRIYHWRKSYGQNANSSDTPIGFSFSHLPYTLSHSECYGVPLCRGSQSRAYLVCLSLFTFGSGLIPHRGGRTPPDVPRLMVFVMTGKPWVHEDYVSSGIMINVAHLLSHTKQMLRMMDQSRE